MINMMLKFGGSPNPKEDDFGLYAVNDEGDSEFQVFKCATLLLFNVCFCCAENSAVISCVAGNNMHTMDVTDEAKLLAMEASSLYPCQGLRA